MSALEHWLQDLFGDMRLRLIAAEPCAGRDVSEHRLLTVDRRGSKETLLLRQGLRRPNSHTLAPDAEFAVLGAVHAAGVTVSRPIAICHDLRVIGSPFFLMEAPKGWVRLSGSGNGMASRSNTHGILERLGRELATLHRLTVSCAGLETLGPTPDKPATSEVKGLLARLDRLCVLRPALEWALRWASLHAPGHCQMALTHRDVRTGNLLIDGDRLAAIIAWQHAGWGDPMADLGWFCAECWRGSRPDLEAGGIGPREPLYHGYRSAGGDLREEAIAYWEVVAHVRAAVMVLEQAVSRARDGETSLEDCLAICRLEELELSALRLTAPERWRATHA